MKLSGEAREAALRKIAEALRLEMEAGASKMKDLILSQPPENLLGYLWSRLGLSSMNDSARRKATPAEIERQRDPLLVALEYVHAVLSCFDIQPAESNNFQEVIEEILSLAESLKETTLRYCLSSSRPRHGTAFPDETGLLEYLAKTTWVSIRGHRYQVLEEEFFRFVLEPHEDALRRAYGIGASDVAMGIQAITNSMREGFGRGTNVLYAQLESTSRRADEQGISLEAVMDQRQKETPDVMAVLGAVHKDLFFGGLCNLSRQTNLPAEFLEDLSFRRGENAEFFDTGQFRGTLLRTLPARIKPLIRLTDGFYASDPQFVRDAAYRAIQRGLLARLPEYREEWNQRQKILTECSFLNIFSQQLKGATTIGEVYYQDPSSGKWVENDTLIILDDVLLQVEVKAGVGAMSSPATSFDNHVRAINGLVIRAYQQTKRFFNYLASAPEVPLYELREGHHRELRRVRLADFRLAIPMGLTVESFSPFSTMCKELPDLEPLLGRYPFVSISIDELLVLNRFLPSAGALFHYLEVRQQLAGIRGTHIFDEMDHLGGYIAKNRLDLSLRAELKKGHDVIFTEGLSAEIDKYFEGDRWLYEAPPSQTYSDELERLFVALGKTGGPGWLKTDATIRDFDSKTRMRLAEMIRTLAATLNENEYRWFLFRGDRPLLVWLQRDRVSLNSAAVIRQAEVAALATKAWDVLALCLLVNGTGDFTGASGVFVESPHSSRENYQELMTNAEALALRVKAERLANPRMRKRPRPNEPCSCGSGRKFKKCHGPA